MIKQLLNSAIAKYLDTLAFDKSRYFAQTRPIIVYYLRFDFFFFSEYFQKIVEVSQY